MESSRESKISMNVTAKVVSSMGFTKGWRACGDFLVLWVSGRTGSSESSLEEIVVLDGESRRAAEDLASRVLPGGKWSFRGKVRSAGECSNVGWEAWIPVSAFGGADLDLEMAVCGLKEGS